MGNLVKEMSGSEIVSTLELFSYLGVEKEYFDYLRSDHEAAARVAKQISLCGWDVPMHRKVARSFLRDNFFGLEEWWQYYRVRFTSVQQEQVRIFPWDAKLLNSPCPFTEGKRIRDTHFAFLGAESIKGRPLNIMRWHEIHPHFVPNPVLCDRHSDIWYSKQTFATETTCGFRWYLMFKGRAPFHGMLYKYLVEQLPQEYEVPTAIEELAKHILFFRKNDKRLDPQGIYDSGGSVCREPAIESERHLVIRHCSVSGIKVDTDGHNSTSSLALSRKLPANQ